MNSTGYQRFHRLLAVLLSELIGELVERAARGRRRPSREFVNGDFVRREQR